MEKMIDTIKLYLGWIDVCEGANLTIVPNSYNLNDEHYEDTMLGVKGIELFGAKAYRTWHKNESQMYDLQIFRHGAKIQFSVPKVLFGNNLNLAGKEELQEALSIVEEDLRQNGIFTDLFTANIGRIDVTKNIYVKHHFTDYLRVLEEFRLPRKKLINYGESIYLRNRSHALLIYDKVSELKQNKSCSYCDLDLLKNKNVLRIENQYLTKRKVNTALKIINTNDLLSNYDNVIRTVKEQTNKAIFSFTFDDIEVYSINRMKQIFSYVYSSSNSIRNRFDRALKLILFDGVWKGKNEAMIIEALEESLIDINVKKDAIYNIVSRARSELKKIKCDLISLEDSNAKVTFKVLYNELKDKYLMTA